MSIARVFTLIVVVIIGLQGPKLIAPWYDDLRLKGAMHDMVGDVHVSTDAAVIHAVLATAQQFQIPLAPRDIHVERPSAGGVRLWAEYEVTVPLPWGFSHTQRFRPEVQSGR